MAENGSTHIDLTDELEQKVTDEYTTLTEDLTKILKNVCDELEEICTNTGYQPMINAVNQTIEAFNEEIFETASSVLNEWTEGEACFLAAAVKSEAGDEGEATALNIDSKILDIFQGFWSGHPMGEEIQVDTSRPQISSSDFDSLKEIYNNACTEIEKCGTDSMNRVKSEGQSSPTYNIVLPAMVALVDPIKVAFEEFAKKVDAFKEESEVLKAEQDSQNEAASQSATQTAATAQDVAASLEMFGNI